MNWKKTLNPWGYARGLAEQLESEEKNSANWEAQQLEMCRKYSFAAASAASWKAQHDGLKAQLSAVKAELAKALEALRIGDERADKYAAACDAAHDAGNFNIAPNIVIAKVRPVNVGAIPKDTRRTKPKTPAQIEADAAREAEVALADAYQERDGEAKRTGK